MFETLAAKFEAAGIVTDAKQYIKALEERETLGSTYMGNMIALPHGKCDAVVKPGIGFCRCKQTFRYCSHDEEGDVRYVFSWRLPLIKAQISICGCLPHWPGC